MVGIFVGFWFRLAIKNQANLIADREFLIASKGSSISGSTIIETGP